MDEFWWRRMPTCARKGKIEDVQGGLLEHGHRLLLQYHPHRQCQSELKARFERLTISEAIAPDLSPDLSTLLVFESLGNLDFSKSQRSAPLAGPVAGLVAAQVLIWCDSLSLYHWVPYTMTSILVEPELPSVAASMSNFLPGTG